MGPNHGYTIPILEEPLKQPPNLILILNTIGVALLQLECRLQILLSREIMPQLIDQLEGEIPDDPQKGRKVRGILARASRLTLDILRQVDYQVERVYGVFVDAAGRIVDEGGA